MSFVWNRCFTLLPLRDYPAGESTDFCQVIDEMKKLSSTDDYVLITMIEFSIVSKRNFVRKVFTFLFPIFSDRNTIEFYPCKSHGRIEILEFPNSL